MHRRIYPLAPLVLLALVAVLAAPASAAQLGKPAARKAAVKTMNRYLASHGWAKAGRVGKCQRKAPRRVVCRITLSGPSRACRTSAAVTLRRKARARLGRLRCAKPAPQQGSRMMRLAAHIGTPKRHLDNPFAVTYPYSASATEQVAARGGETEEPVPPPKGVLALYIDGVLECAMNTEGVVAGDECPHVYGKLGQHRVTAIYTAGSESAVDTTLHNVDPLPTEIALSVTYEPLAVASTEGEYWWRIGTVKVQASTSPINRSISLTCQDTVVCPEAEVDGAVELPVFGLQCGSNRIIGRNAEPLCEAKIGASWMPLETFEEEGIIFNGKLNPPAGYLPSQASATVSFTPTLIFPPCEEGSPNPWCP